MVHPDDKVMSEKIHTSYFKITLAVVLPVSQASLKDRVATQLDTIGPNASTKYYVRCYQTFELMWIGSVRCGLLHLKTHYLSVFSPSSFL